MKGATEEITDALDPARAAALHAALGYEGPPPSHGEPLPALWHLLHFWDTQPPQNLGPDGHPRTGTGLIPDLGLPRRMWAGGRVSFHTPLLAGIRATRLSRVTSVSRKRGRTGELGFVTLRHDIRQRGALVLTDEQHLVYREADARPGTPPAIETTPLAKETRGFDSTLLFRYSALTFNGHRIHYDADYARDTEGYPGLVVHGPLLATILAGLAERRVGRLRSFAFRATSPLCLPEQATFNANATDFWATGEDGRCLMQAEALPA